MEFLIGKLNDAGLWENEITLRRHELLKAPGTVDTRIFLVVEGTLRAYMMDMADEHTIRFGYPGNIMAALDSFVTERPSSLTLQAIRSSKVLAMGKSSFTRIINIEPEHLVLWNKILEGLVVQQLERETDLLTASPAERYERVLKRSPRLFQEIPSKYIAS
ncbi:MAG TPA: cyclic nucleotide-binding domain-containing protein [Phnomibacter sp.]|nr:cyclic nucleotide-binding domain-containing protein [Phnomibacter sp.]